MLSYKNNFILIRRITISFNSSSDTIEYFYYYSCLSFYYFHLDLDIYKIDIEIIIFKINFIETILYLLYNLLPYWDREE